MTALTRWLLLYFICLIAIFSAHSAIGQSTARITAEEAEFEYEKSLGGNTEFQSTIFEILPSFVTGRNSEFVKNLALIMPDHTLAESAHSYISVRGAEFVYHKNFSDPLVTQSPLEYCQTGLGADTIQELENKLKKRAKQAAAIELLNAQVTSIRGLASCNPTGDDVTALLTDFIKISEDPRYFNHKDIFAEVCISILPYVEEENVNEMDLKTIAEDVCNTP